MGSQDADIGVLAKAFIETTPLQKGTIPRRSVQIAGHPWIDDVSHVIELRGTHEVGRAVEVRQQGDRLADCISGAVDCNGWGAIC